MIKKVLKTLIITFGIISIILGQWMIDAASSFKLPKEIFIKVNPIVNWLQMNFHLNIPYYTNVMVGFTTLVFGGLILTVFIKKSLLTITIKEEKTKSKDLIHILALCILAFLIFTFRLDNIPNSFMGDEGIFLERANIIAQGREKLTIFDSGPYGFPLAGSYYQGLFLKIFGVSLWSWRFSSIMVIIFSIPIFFILVKNLFSRRIAYLATIFLIISPYSIAFARLGYTNIHSLLLTILPLSIFVIALKKSSYIWIGITGLTVGFSWYSYFASRVTILIILLYLVYFLLVKKIVIKKFVGFVILIFIGFSLVVAPYFIQNARNNNRLVNDKFFESIFANSWNANVYFPEINKAEFAKPVMIGNQELFFHPELYFRLIVRGTIRTLIAFNYAGIIDEHYITSPLAGQILSIFYLLGLIICFVRINNARYAFLLIWFWTCFFLLSALNTIGARQTHLIPIIPVLAILSALSLDLITTVIKRRIMFRKKINICNILLVFVIMIFTMINLYSYFVLMPAKYLPNMDDIMAWVAKDTKSEITLVYIYPKRLSDNPNFHVHEGGWTKYLKEKLDLQNINFISYNSELIGINSPKLIKGKQYQIFFEPYKAELMDMILMTLIGNKKKLNNYYDANGKVIGFSTDSFIL